ncbi:UNVERIFIED_CONTAM: hypothetical protein Cloal_1619 [Acetivibrio alkalicellulosi]
MIKLRRTKWKKVVLWISFLCILAVIGIGCFFAYSFKFYDNKAEANMTTNTSSSDLNTKDEKLNFLKKYMVLNSEVIDTEFHIIYQDNSGGVPGPSYWDIKLALKVSKDETSKWVNEYEEIPADMISLDWWQELYLDDKLWNRPSIPQYYKRANASSYIVIYKEEGIILKYVTTMKPILKK